MSDPSALATYAVLILAVLTALGGRPLFDFLTARTKGRAAIDAKDRAEFRRAQDEFKREQEAFKAEQRDWQAQQRREMVSLRTENRTMREALNDTQVRCAILESELDTTKRELSEAHEQIVDLTAEVARLRGAA